MLRAVLCSILLVLAVACGNTAAPVAADGMEGKWCPVDSLTVYTVDQPVGKPIVLYVPGNVVDHYRLTFDGYGHVVADGLYTGLFKSGIDSTLTDTASFFLPLEGVHGTYEIGEAYMRFTWPYPEAGPTWFWEIARNTIVDEGHWYTLLDDSDGTFWRFYLRFTWERC